MNPVLIHSQSHQTICKPQKEPSPNMHVFARISTALLYSAVALLFALAANRAAITQSITFSPVEKPIILPGTAQPSSNVAVDAAGNVYAADNGTNQLIKITPFGVQSVMASELNLGTDIEGLTFDFRDFAVDGSGNRFISDNPASQVVKVSLSDAQTVLASGFAPENIAFDPSGNVFVTDQTNNRVLKIALSGAQTVFATGLNTPNGLAVDSADNVYVAQSEGQCCVNSESFRSHLRV